MGWMWLLIIALVIAAIIAKLRRSSRIFIIRQNFQHGENPFQNTSPSPRPHIQRRGEVEHMVCCVECGIYIPGFGSTGAFRKNLLLQGAQRRLFLFQKILITVLVFVSGDSVNGVRHVYVIVKLDCLPDLFHAVSGSHFLGRDVIVPYDGIHFRQPQ